MTWRTFAPREQKALKIQCILADFLGDRCLSELRCLDIGCGNGEITHRLADQLGDIIALDNVFDLVHRAHKRELASVVFLQADGVRLPFAGETFDLVICAQVYEHIAHAEWLPAEAERVLKPGGLCFFSGPNRLALIEDHYGLPFLSWLPRRVADSYVRLFRRGVRYDISPWSYWRLRQLWRRFEIHDYTLRMMRFPERYALESGLGKLAWARRLPALLLRTLIPLMPNYNWVLRRADCVVQNPRR